jgi:hypothetical protein
MNCPPSANMFMIRAPFARPRRDADVARARRRGDRIMHPICPRRLLQCLSQLWRKAVVRGMSGYGTCYSAPSPRVSTAVPRPCRTFAPEQMSFNRSVTRSQARSLLSMARLKMTRSRHDRAISRRTRMDQTCFGSRGFFLADEQSLIPRSLVSADRTYKHGGSSATPPSASLYRERIIKAHRIIVWNSPS